MRTFGRKVKGFDPEKFTDNFFEKYDKFFAWWGLIWLFVILPIYIAFITTCLVIGLLYIFTGG